MKIIKVVLFVMALVLALAAFTGCELPGAECTHEGYEAIRQSVIPTCTETGLSLGVYCSNCDAVIKEQEVTEARGHDKKVSVGTTATCTEAGVETLRNKKKPFKKGSFDNILKGSCDNCGSLHHQQGKGRTAYRHKKQHKRRIRSGGHL